MIIDVHGHYTTAPDDLPAFRDAYLAHVTDLTAPVPTPPAIDDDALRQSIETGQLRVLRERGEDFMLLSPKASGMRHDIADVQASIAWASISNDVIARIVGLFPETFAGVCQSPQTPIGPIEPTVTELRRAVSELGFVGCLINPDPSGGHWTSAPLTDKFWFPLYEAMVELNVPGMVHVSESRNRSVNTLGAHYLNSDTTAFMQLLEGDLFKDFPTLRLIIPHGGGAAPYHWGRYRGLATRMGVEGPRERLLGNVYFDTAVYHRLGIRLLFDVVDHQNLLFASEMLGAVRGTNPETGSDWDNTLLYIDSLALDDSDRMLVFEQNARRVFPRLSDRLDELAVQFADGLLSQAGAS